MQSEWYFHYWNRDKFTTNIVTSKKAFQTVILSFKQNSTAQKKREKTINKEKDHTPLETLSSTSPSAPSQELARQQHQSRLTRGLEPAMMCSPEKERMQTKQHILKERYIKVGSKIGNLLILLKNPNRKRKNNQICQKLERKIEKLTIQGKWPKSRLRKEDCDKIKSRRQHAKPWALRLMHGHPGFQPIQLWGSALAEFCSPIRNGKTDGTVNDGPTN